MEILNKNVMYPFDLSNLFSTDSEDRLQYQPPESKKRVGQHLISFLFSLWGMQLPAMTLEWVREEFVLDRKVCKE
ncbi:hypothetical protein Y032_0289g1514 [Ancylostoma ceylanicum]|uniref:Uncharacterized protein n=1 Tax=Ancylostoma ceylanicum TaxID=53326 RepID=A0A016S6M1_9BILA|nr:hypothetical protein Y032_0289g1514 [Ancylostoma ceylanicum]